MIPSAGEEVRISAEALCEATGITRVTLTRLVRLAVVAPVSSGPDEFPAEAVRRLRKILRLRRELGVGTVGAAVIVDLLERLRGLEAELASLRRVR